MRTGLLALALVVLLGGGAAFFVLSGGLPRPARTRDTVYLLTLADLSVNLADQDHPHYLMASLSLAIAGERPEERVPEQDAQIRDAVLMVMTRHAYHQLLSAEGKGKLKDELAAAVTEVLSEEKLRVKEVLFTSFIMN